MTHVHYKFSSKLSYDTVLFDGPHITLRDLKRQIMGREKLRAGDCDLQITNAQTKEEYTDDEGLIPKGSSVIVRRIPIIAVKSSSSSKNHNIERSDNQHHHASGAIKAMDDHNSSRALPFFSKMTNLAHADVSEDDKIKAVMNQSAYDSMSYTKKLGAVLPANYACYRCGNTGHHIRNCPTSGDKNVEAPLRIKKSTGIPRSFMVEVDDPSIKGAMLTNCGRYAIPAIDAEAYAIGKKEKPPFIPQEQPKSEVEDDPVPDELLCLICHDLLSDAVVIPCCGNSYCDDCIRTALLDSEEHVCPTCSQSDVSPDTLIANKFLRQAVNNYKKERGHTKNLRGVSGTSQSLNPTPIPSPVPTPPPIATQSQPQKPHQLTHSQQPADTPPLSQVSEAPPAVTGPTSASSIPSTSLQPVQSHLEIPDKEAEGKKHNDSVPAAVPSVLVSNKDPIAAPSQLIPLVTHTPVADQLPSVSVNPQQSSSGPAPRHSGPSTCWDGSSSSSGCPTVGWTESNTQQLPPLSSSSSSTSYSTTPPPPLFPSPHFHTFLSAQQPLSGFPPGYPPTTPIWTLPNPQGAPIPSLCSSTSSIPALIPKEWFRHQGKKKERSPHRGSAYRRSSSRSNSKSSKSKSSRSYSRSSSRSRSRSRSRSQGRSRPRSPYSRARDLHSRSHPSRSYSYGYKRSRSPTPSSSSSPRVGHHSRSKSPSDHRKRRHHSKKSASSSYSSRRGGERSSTSGLSQREAGGSWGNLVTHPYDLHVNQDSSLEMDRERYLQCKKEYKEWCEKYFSSYVSHFHQLPPSLLTLPPPPNPYWGDREGSRNHLQGNLDSRYGLQGRRTARTDGHSHPSQSSSDSRSSPSQSSSDSRSPPSQSSSDSRSPASRPSSDTSSAPSEERAHQTRCAEKDSRLPVRPREGSKQVEVQERSKDKKQLISKNLEDLSALEHAQKRMRKHEGGKVEESSSLDAADSTDDSRNNKRRHNTRPSDASDVVDSVQVPLKPDKPSDKNYERRSREQRNLEREKGWRRGRESDYRQDLERHHKVKPSEEAGRVDTDRARNPGGSKASDSRSEKKRKRKGEGVERNERERSPSVKTQSSKCLKTKVTEDAETRKSESPKRFDRETPQKEKKKEKKTWPLKERDIWEGEIVKVKPQKKISININLDGKRKEEKNEKQDLSYSEMIAEKSKEGVEKTATGEEERLNRETEIIVNERKESSEQKGVLEEKIKPDEKEAREMWEKATFRDDKGETWEKIAREEEDIREKKGDGEEEDFNLWHCALRGVGIGDGAEASKREELTGVDRRSVRGKEEEEERVISDNSAQEMAQSVAGTRTPPGVYKPKEEVTEGEPRSQWSRNETHRYRPNTMVEDGSTPTVGSWGGEDCQDRRTVMKTLEEYTQDRAEDREDKLLLVQVPRSKWEKEESEGEGQDEGEIKVQTDTLSVALPTPPVTQTNKETEGENERKRPRSVERQRDRERATERGRDREKEKNSTMANSARSVAPSSGKDRTDSSSCTDRDRDRDRGRERERQERRSQKESERAKERIRDEERGRDREREREHSSILRRSLPSSTHYSSSSASHDTERRDRQRGGDQGSNKSPSRPSRIKEISLISRTAEAPDQNTHKTHKDTLLDLKSKGKEEEQKGLHDYYHHNHRDPTQPCRREDAPAGTRHSPSSLSHSWGKERDQFPSKSPRRLQGESEPSKPRMSSPNPELIHVARSDQPNTWRSMSQHAALPAEPPKSSQDTTSSSEREKEKRENRRRNDSREEKGEWKRYKLDKVIKENKGERETREIETERERGSQWEADELDGEPKWGAGRELEEGERPSSRSSSSVSSSASQGNSRDDRRKDRKKKQKKHKKERRHSGPELEEGELKKHKKKKSKKNKEESKEESSGEVDDRWKEEEDHAKLPFSVQKVPGFNF
ncbi:E3 ubiquitin-protein ligase RBBP6-like isoform X2 [Thunnus maccoyii]|uniref:E3 ubiquitin-protein ligase RBBP6-like isoform X2 n=1 Tax=Thunnus maccoyii TaxID=8240 RepID=UPI001C4BA0F6|nr:E3 ubiquitin-protein ligase RBBP6-like isoform X2 [Thunnus maccoyii]